MLLKLVKISKSFPGVQALDNVDFDLNEGEVHGLVGENGAGKSTLIKIISGVQAADSGEIYICDEKVVLRDPAHARELKIRAIYQEFTLVPYLTVAENITLGDPPMKNKALGLIDWDKMREETRSILNRLDFNTDPNREIEDLGIAERQMVEIAKALHGKARILIMDEPTSALCPKETAQLYKTIRSLKSEGVGIIYISHRLEEILEVADRVTVLRDGNVIITAPVSEFPVEKLIQHIVGRKLQDMYPKVHVNRGKEVLRVEGLTLEGKFRDISFRLHQGEVLGIAGLVGAGRTELAKTIFGEFSLDKGTIWVDGNKVQIQNPIEAIRLGIGYLPEDRKVDGLVLKMSVRHNLTLATLDYLSKLGVINLSSEKSRANQLVNELAIATPDLNRKVVFLSGGNQQKVVVGKWLSSNAKILIFDEPTRGIDIGAKVEIYNLINELVRNGVGIIMISSETPELMGMADRILVMHEGRLITECLPDEITQELLLTYCFGIVKEKVTA
jgi:ribose transport system ATP-binding protein